MYRYPAGEVGDAVSRHIAVAMILTTHTETDVMRSVQVAHHETTTTAHRTALSQ